LKFYTRTRSAAARPTSFTSLYFRVITTISCCRQSRLCWHDVTYPLLKVQSNTNWLLGINVPVEGIVCRLFAALLPLFVVQLYCVHFVQEEDEESVKGVFYNDMYTLELDKGRWHQQFLRYEKLQIPSLH